MQFRGRGDTKHNFSVKQDPRRRAKGAKQEHSSDAAGNKSIFKRFSPLKADSPGAKPKHKFSNDQQEGRLNDTRHKQELANALSIVMQMPATRISSTSQSRYETINPSVKGDQYVSVEQPPMPIPSESPITLALNAPKRGSPRKANNEN